MSGDYQAPGARTPMPPEMTRMERLLISIHAPMDIGGARAAAQLEFDGIRRDERIAALFNLHLWPETSDVLRNAALSSLFGVLKSHPAHFLLSWSPTEVNRFLVSLISAATAEKDRARRSLLTRCVIATLKRIDGGSHDVSFETIFPTVIKLMEDDNYAQHEAVEWLSTTNPGQSSHLPTILRVLIESAVSIGTDSGVEATEDNAAQILASLCIAAPSAIPLQLVPKIVKVVLNIIAHAVGWSVEWRKSKSARLMDDVLSSLGPALTQPILLKIFADTKNNDDSTERLKGVIALMEAGERSRGREEEERTAHKIIDCLSDTVDTVRKVASATLIRLIPRWSPYLHNKVMATISAKIDGLLNNESNASIIDLSPFLPTLMPSILKAAREGDDDADEKSIPSQKDVAQRKLLGLVKAVGDAFVPYVDQTAALLILSLSKSDEDSEWALQMVPLLLKVAKSQVVMEAVVLWLKLWPALKGRGGMREEQRGVLYETVRACRELLGKEIIGHVEWAEIKQLLKEE